MSGYGDTRMAIPPVRCSHKATSTGERCRRYSRPGTGVCAKHGARRDDIHDKAAAVTTLATLLAGDPRPLAVAIQDHLNTLDSVARMAHTTVLREEAERGTADAQSVTQALDTARAALAAMLATTRTAAWEKIARSHGDRFEVEADTVFYVTEQALKAVGVWLEAAGLERARTLELKQYAAFAIRDAMSEVRRYITERARRPSSAELERLFWDMPPPELENPPEVVIISRAELSALREQARRHTPQIASRPADIAPPDDFTPASPATGAPRTSGARPPGIGLIDTRTTAHFR